MTRPRIHLAPELIYDLQHVAVEVARERKLDSLPVNELVTEVVYAFVVESRTKYSWPRPAQDEQVEGA